MITIDGVTGKADMHAKPSSSEPLVVGLAGAIGSGKSTVARQFSRLGWVVIDFDEEIDHALRRPEVIREIAGWWGNQVVDEGGQIDRRVIADIVFQDSGARRQLESFLHPLVWVTREEARERARSRGAPGIVLDAPLLFESGLDRECDAVVFVEAPPQIRRSRVAASRGWEEGELRRREESQLPIEEKRRRSRFVIHNDSDESALLERVRGVFATLMASQGDTGR